MNKKHLGTMQNTGTMPTPSISVLQRVNESLDVLDTLDVLVPKACSPGGVRINTWVSLRLTFVGGCVTGGR